MYVLLVWKKSPVLTTSTDEPKILEGLPAHVQIMGKTMKDEELVEILKVVEKTLAE